MEKGLVAPRALDADEIEGGAVEIVGAGFGDRGDDASGGVAVERGVVLAADAELADGFFGEGVGHSGVAAVASSS